MTELEKLRAVVKRLRAEDGCPWDKVQTHESLKPEVIEEAAEVIGLTMSRKLPVRKWYAGIRMSLAAVILQERSH